jgi:expansin (peptidoglycan-binding protein)
MKIPLGRRWLLPTIGGGVLGVAAVTVALVMSAAGNPACAAPPGTAKASGKATYFDGSKGGNCSFGPPSSDLYVALGPSEYAAGAACGGYLDVTGPKGTVRVKVVDQCPECEPGHLDLSRAAFARIGAVVDGIIPITYRGVQNPGLPGPLTLRVKDGASRYWLAILADNHGNPLRSVEVKSGSGFTAMQRTDYNYWIAGNGAGTGPFTLRLTDIYGHRATVSGITLSPLKNQKTTTMMYRTSAAGGSAAAPAKPVGPVASKSAASPAAASASATAGAVSAAGNDGAAGAPSPWSSAATSAAPGACRH